ncbi:hypothetical protein Droror1_Dr00024354 [Drosera rotundifolia]
MIKGNKLHYQSRNNRSIGHSYKHNKSHILNAHASTASCPMDITMRRSSSQNPKSQDIRFQLHQSVPPSETLIYSKSMQIPPPRSDPKQTRSEPSRPFKATGTLAPKFSTSGIRNPKWEFPFLGSANGGAPAPRIHRVDPPLSRLLVDDGIAVVAGGGGRWHARRGAVEWRWFTTGMGQGEETAMMGLGGWSIGQRRLRKKMKK